MICPNCGKQITEGDIFCGKCGARIEEPSQEPAVGKPDEPAQEPTRELPQEPLRELPQEPTQEPLQQPSQGLLQQPLQELPQEPTQQPSQESTQGPAFVAARTSPYKPNSSREEFSKRSRTIVIALIVALALVVGTIAGVLLWRQNQRDVAESVAVQAAYDAAHTRHAIVFKVDAPGYSYANASRIPVHVMGSDADGVSVDEDAFIDAAGEGLELAYGTYVVNVIASPLTSDGTVYVVPSQQWHISIGEDVALDASIDATGQPMSFTTVSDLTALTDEQIAQIHDYAVKSGMDAATADAYRDTLTTNRQTALDQKAAEEAAAAEAQREAEEAAAEKAKYHVVTDYYEFDVPEYWWGRVNYSVRGSTVKIYANVKDSMFLVSVVVVDSSEQLLGGDIAGGLIYHKDNGSGKRIEMRCANMPYLVWDQYQHRKNGNTYSSDMSDDEASELLDLETGGAISLSEAQASGNTLRSSYILDTIEPTLVVK